MTENSRAEQHEHELTLHVFTTSAAMVGVCLTAIGILRLVTSQTRVETIGDELLAADAALFMMCCLLSFWSFKTRWPRWRIALRLAIDSVFLIALLAMAVVCSLIAYTVA